MGITYEGRRLVQPVMLPTTLRIHLQYYMVSPVFR